MKIFETSVRKPISTILIFIGVIIMGLYSMRNIAIDLYPDMDIPTITVMTQYYGVNASDIEMNVTKILEDNLNSVDKLDKITSKTIDNMSIVTLEFEWGSDLTEAANDVRDAISRTEQFLPEDAEKPILLKFSSSMIPVMMLSATAEESYPALEKIIDDKFVNRVNRIDGVGAVSLSGTPVREIQVMIDPNKIEAYNLSVEQIGQIINSENINISGGEIDLGSNTLSIRSEGEFQSSEEVSNTFLTNINGRRILVKDVATVKDTLRELAVDQRTNSIRSLQMNVMKQSGANTVEIAQKVLEIIPEVEKTLPPDVKIDVLFDSSDNIKKSISSLSETIMYAFIFVILVVLVFLGRWRATFIIGLTIPVSLITSFIYLYMTGDSINIISLSSLSIAIGMVVDDAIVVLENITKHMERGAAPREASIYGTNEVWLAVIATTLTVLAVFLPLTTLSGMAGIMFKSLGWIVSIVTMVSTVAAVSLTPMLTSQLLKVKDLAAPRRGLGVIFKPIEKVLDKVDNGYGNMLKWALSHKTFVLSLAVLIFASSLLLIRQVPTEFFPAQDNGLIGSTIKVQQGLSIEETVKTARKIEELVKTNYEGLEIYSTTTGSDPDNTYAMMQENGSYIIKLILRFNDKEYRSKDIFDIADEIRADLTQIPEVVQAVVTPGSTSSEGRGMGAASNVKIKIFGHDFNETDRFAKLLVDKTKLIDGTRDVKLSRDDLRPEYIIKYDRERLAFYGLNTATVGSYVRNRISGMRASIYREDGEEYDIIVRYDKSFRRDINEVENILIYTNNGKAVRLKDVATVVETFAPPTIEREDRQRMLSVNASLASGAALGKIAQDVKLMLDKTEIPDGIFVDLGGTIEDQQESFGDLMILLLLIVIMVYIVMATQFESFRMPFIIMFSLPFAFTGVFLALFFTGMPLSVIALIGAIMLVGIVVKNGIVIVDFMNLLRERGYSISQSVIAAGRSRLRPVLMTTLTTILGMIPLAFAAGQGSEAWQPMGIAVIGGLTFSTILTLVVIPIIYALFSYNDLRKSAVSRRKAIKKRRQN